MSEENGEKKKTIHWADAWKEAKVIIWSRRWRLVIGLALMLITRPIGMLPQTSIIFVLDNVLGDQQIALPGVLAVFNASLAGFDKLGLLNLIVAVVLASVLIQAGTSFFLAQFLGVTAQRAIADMRRRVEEHVARLPTRFFESHKSGELISRIMTDAEGVRNLVGNGLVQLFGSLLTGGIALAVLLVLNWKLTAVILVLLVSYAVALALFFRYLRPLFRERGKINADVTGRLAETLGGIRIVKVYTAEKREERIFAHGVHRLLKNVARTITATSGVGSFSSLVFGFVIVVLMVVGSRELLAYQANDATGMSPGQLGAYVAFTLTMIAPLIQISNIGTQISEAFAGLDRIRELMREETEDAGDAERGRLREIRGDVVFEDVRFAYEEGVPVLKGISFTAPASTTTALVGSSGSGKSTIIGLVTAFHRPGDGRVTVDGHDLARVRLRDYRRHLGVVLQESFLFDGTIAENIAYGNPRAPREEIEEAGRIAWCEEFVSGFEKGYDTVIGERGIKLSGGQRQRIAIARAILADPRILILDEATSSLDSESEGMIQEALARLRSGRTTFVIAHRLSTIRSADQILVVEEGAIVERGTHAELLAAGGRYRELYDKQYRFESDRFINPGEELGVEEGDAAPAAARSRAPSLIRPE